MTEPKSVSTIFLDLIVAFLAPMFLSDTGGDVAYARAAAIETVNAYRAETQTDLLSVAQIIAFGLAALGSLSLAMADNLSISLTLRLRANAAASHRAAESSRRALAQARPGGVQPPPRRHLEDDSLPDEATIIANVQQVRQQAKAAAAALEKPQPPAPQPPQPQPRSAQPLPQPQPPQPQPAAPQPKPQPQSAAPQPPQPQSRPTAMDDQNHRTAWANAMAHVAGEVTASLPHLPPNERKEASIRAAALSSAATDLLAGKDGQFPFPQNLQRPAPSR
jgi:outer membrane biosynthesis protein TonB